MILAAQIFVSFTLVVILFQLALAAGLPWGNVAMGGKFPGRLPPVMRFACLIQIGSLAFFSAIVCAKAGLGFSEWHSASAKAIWGVVVFSAVAVVANLITPSKWERILWAPVAVVMLVCSIYVATVSH